MATDFLYLHIDTISNSLFARGLTLEDFSSSLADLPEQILLLDAQETEGEYDPHTGLRVVKGQENVATYFSQYEKKGNGQLKWLDFKELDLLLQLTPMEIAELLYFGHMMSQLRSPFFYKLQNKYVYFEKPGDMTKVYYRHMDDFYRLISYKVSDIAFQKVNRRKGWFKPLLPISPIDPEEIKLLKIAFQEGVIFDTRRHVDQNGCLTIPLYFGDDRMKTIKPKNLKAENEVGVIKYDLTKDSWEIKILDPWLAMTVKKSK